MQLMECYGEYNDTQFDDTPTNQYIIADLTFNYLYDEIDQNDIYSDTLDMAKEMFDTGQYIILVYLSNNHYVSRIAVLINTTEKVSFSCKKNIIEQFKERLANSTKYSEIHPTEPIYTFGKKNAVYVLRDNNGNIASRLADYAKGGVPYFEVINTPAHSIDVPKKEIQSNPVNTTNDVKENIAPSPPPTEDNMPKKKTCYFFQFPDNFFQLDKIKALMGLSHKAGVLIYLELCADSLKNNGILKFYHSKKTFPAEIAYNLNENPKKIDELFKNLQKLGLLEYRGNEEILFPQVIEFTRSQSYDAIKQQRYRDRHKQDK